MLKSVSSIDLVMPAYVIEYRRKGTVSYMRKRSKAEAEYTAQILRRAGYAISIVRVRTSS